MSIPDDIIVVGKRPAIQTAGNYVNYGNGMYGFKSSEPDYPPTKRPADAQDGDIVVIVHASNEANADGVRAAAQNVARTVAILTPLVNALAESTVYKLGDGAKMTGAEIKRLWKQTQFYVSDTVYRVNSAGAVKFRDGVFLDQLDYKSFQGPNSYADPVKFDNNQGMNFIILHEVMHLTEAAGAHESDMWTNFRETVPNPTDERWYSNFGGWFGQNEKYVNTATKVLEKAMGLLPLPNPRWGYMPQ